jgi:hypothetical protein
VSVFKASNSFSRDGPGVDSRRSSGRCAGWLALSGADVVRVRAGPGGRLILMIGAMKSSSFAERLESYPRRSFSVVGDRADIQELAIGAGSVPS